MNLNGLINDGYEKYIEALNEELKVKMHDLEKAYANQEDGKIRKEIIAKMKLLKAEYKMKMKEARDGLY